MIDRTGVIGNIGCISIQENTFVGGVPGAGQIGQVSQAILAQFEQRSAFAGEHAALRCPWTAPSQVGLVASHRIDAIVVRKQVWAVQAGDQALGQFGPGIEWRLGNGNERRAAFVAEGTVGEICIFQAGGRDQAAIRQEFDLRLVVALAFVDLRDDFPIDPIHRLEQDGLAMFVPIGRVIESYPILRFWPPE